MERQTTWEDSVRVTRILAIDLDETLLQSDNSISQATMDALEAWRAAGHRIVIATGRPPRSAQLVIPPELADCHRIVYNGARIYLDGKLIYHNPVPPAVVTEILTLVEQYAPDWYVGLEIDDVLYVNRHVPKPGQFEVTDLRSLAHRPADKIIFFFPVPRDDGRSDQPAGPDQRDELALFLAHLPPTVRALVTPKFRMVQLCAATTDKATALLHLLEHWGDSLADVVAFGDDVNDIEMIRRCGTGVAMANALPEVKQVANVVTTSNNEDGVARVLQSLLAEMSPAG
jgi:HAD superfamily hydrolase (TIGR01484 family)